MTGKYLILRITSDAKDGEGCVVGIDDLITMLCIAKDHFIDPVVRLGKLSNYPNSPYLAVTSDGPNTTARRFSEPEPAEPTATPISTIKVDTTWLAPEPTTAGDPMTVARTPFIQITPEPMTDAEWEPFAEAIGVEPEPEPMTDAERKSAVAHWKCSECPSRYFATEQGLTTHRNMMHSPKETGHVCADCGRTYAKPSSLRTHRVRQHTEVPAPVVAMVPCPWCDRKFDDEFGRDIHVTAMHTAEQAKFQAAIDDHPSTQRVLGVVPEPEVDPVVNVSVPTADMGTMPKEYATNPVVGDKVVACTECDFVTHAATSELMQQHTFKVHKRIRNLTEKRPFVLGADDGGDAA